MSLDADLYLGFRRNQGLRLQPPVSQWWVGSAFQAQFTHKFSIATSHNKLLVTAQAEVHLGGITVKVRAYFAGICGHVPIS